MSARVAVLAGGLSHERDISLRSGRRVADALRGAGLETSQHDADAALLPALLADPPDVVLPMLHGRAGEDGALQEVLDLLGIRYVGSNGEACRAAFDKPIARARVARAGVDVPRGTVLPHATFRELGAAAVLDALVDVIGLPVVVKPSCGGSALGVSIVTSRAGLPAAMVAAFAYHDTVLVERQVVGVEVAVGVLERPGAAAAALPAVEIVPDGGVYDYAARYTAGLTEFFAPARLGPAVTEECARVALASHVALGLRDWSRTDLIVDSDGRPWFLEANVAPGMTETSLFPLAVGAAGLELGEVCRDLVERAAAHTR